jgi:Entner-Doudoroff aldolase
VVATFARQRAVGILRASDAAAGRAAMEAALRGGFSLVEVTLTTPGAMDLVGDLASRPELVVGAGTVLEVEQAREAARRGASFVVSPVLDEAVVGAARALDVAAVPGCHTPSELLRAHRLGAPLQKLFPAPAGGPEYLRSCLAPLPFLRVVPTNGVTAANARDWLAAGAWAVGFARELFPPGELAEGRFDLVEGRARELLAAVRTG